MSRMFVSYSRVDRVSAEEITKRLRDVYGYENVWMDDALSGGDIWWDEILRAINRCDIFLFLLSNDAVNSPYCRAEYQEAIRLHKRIITAQVSPGTVLTDDLHQRQYVELSNWAHDPDQLNALHRAIHKQEGLIEKRARVRQTGPTPRPILPDEDPTPPPTQRGRRWALLVSGGLLGLMIWGAVVVFGEPSSADPTPTAKQASFTAPPAALATPTIMPTVTDTATLPPTAGPSVTPLPTSTPHPSELLAQAGVAHNAEWTPYGVAMDGVEMLLVPAGCFEMGSSDDQLAYAATLWDDDNPDATPPPLTNEQPAHQICFEAPFWIDRYEVTNAQFEQFSGVAADTSNWPDANRPRERLSWDEARDFCALRGARLPTEAEWEYAARGPDNLIFPWGDTYEPALVISLKNSDLQTGAVGERPDDVSWVGTHEMIGNVAEWVSTLYRAYPYTVGDGRENTTSRAVRVLRGGSYAFSPINLRASGRYSAAPNLAGNGFGLRCVRDFVSTP